MFRDIGLLDTAVKLDNIITLCFAAGSGFTIFMGPLRGVIFIILF